MQLDKVITADDRKMRLPWWAVLCIIAGGLPLMFLFDYLGKFALARPALDSMAMVAIAIAMRWKLRWHGWFWMTITVIVALHILLIVFVPWTAEWVPAIVIIPIGIADLFAMLAIVSVVGKFVEGPKPLKDKRPAS